jgi:hypothetical protein
MTDSIYNGTNVGFAFKRTTGILRQMVPSYKDKVYKIQFGAFELDKIKNQSK